MVETRALNSLIFVLINISIMLIFCYFYYDYVYSGYFFILVIFILVIRVIVIFIFIFMSEPRARPPSLSPLAVAANEKTEKEERIWLSRPPAQRTIPRKWRRRKPKLHIPWASSGRGGVLNVPLFARPVLR